MIRLREFTQAEAEIFVHPGEKNHHPAFKRYADYRMPLLTFVHQQKCEPAVEMTMRDAVDSGIIANEYVAYYVALTHELLVMVGIRPDGSGSASTSLMNGRTTRLTAGMLRYTRNVLAGWRRSGSPTGQITISMPTQHKAKRQ